MDDLMKQFKVASLEELTDRIRKMGTRRLTVTKGTDISFTLEFNNNEKAIINTSKELTL